MEYDRRLVCFARAYLQSTFVNKDELDTQTRTSCQITLIRIAMIGLYKKNRRASLDLL
jgi:hypothetical protein